MLRGRFFSRRSRYGAALQSFQDALVLRPDDLLALAWVGYSYLSLRRYQDAVSIFERAVQQRSDFAWCHAEMGRALCLLGDWQQSADSINRAFRMERKYRKEVRYLIALASAHSHLGDDVLTAQIYCETVTLQPGNDEAQLCAGLTLLRLGNNTDAESHLRRAAALKPDDADAHYNLGLVLFNLKRFSASEREYRAAVELSPARPDFQYSLGCVHSHEEKNAEADRCYEEALKSTPQHVDALSNLSLAYLITERWSDDVVEVAKRYIARLLKTTCSIAPCSKTFSPVTVSWENGAVSPNATWRSHDQIRMARTTTQTPLRGKAPHP